MFCSIFVPLFGNMAKRTEEERLFLKVEEKIRKAIREYQLIAEGDKILIGLSDVSEYVCSGAKHGFSDFRGYSGTK